MKKVLLGVVLCGVTSACMANEKTVKTNLDTKEQVCRFVLKLAGGVIQGKQNGVPISDVLEIKDKLRKNFAQDGELGEMAIQWVIEDAYKLPYYTDEEFDIHDDQDRIPNDPLDNGNVDDNHAENTKPDRKLSIREALSEAVKKSNNDDIDAVKPQNKSVKNKTNKEEAEENEGNNEDETKGEETPIKAVKTQEKKNTAEKPDTSDEDTDKPAKQESKSKAPVGWAKEAKAKWDSLPTEVRDAVAKREKEVSDGFKQYGEKAQCIVTGKQCYHRL